MASWIVDYSEARAGSASVSVSNGVPVLHETYSFIVQTDDKATARSDVLYGTPGLPRVRETLSAYGAAICKSVDATRREANPYLWDVSATFSSEVEEGQDGPDSQDPNSDPVVWLPVYETKFERLQEMVNRDKDGDAIVNSANQPFPVGVTVSRFIPVWEFYQFEPPISDEALIARNETVNSVQFKGRAIKTLLLTVLSSRIGFYYGRRLRLTQYSLKYNSRKWTHKRADVGTMYVDGSTLKPYTVGGVVILGNLDGTGAKSATGTLPAILEFDLYDESTFSFLRV